MVFMPVLSDPQDGVPVGERAPQRAGLALQTPTGLIHVKRAGTPDLIQQILIRVGERISGPGEHRVHGTGTDPGVEQLLKQLNDIAP